PRLLRPLKREHRESRSCDRFGLGWPAPRSANQVQIDRMNDSPDVRASRGAKGAGLAGFGLPDDQGVWKGLDVDECRAIAAAIFNDPNKVKHLAINAKDRPTILASGEI